MDHKIFENENEEEIAAKSPMLIIDKAESFNEHLEKRRWAILLMFSLFT